MLVLVVRIHGNIYRNLCVVIGYGFRCSWINTLKGFAI